ncbi:MAG: 60S ribosomal protein L22 [Candidatus Bathyarchaeota archaeon]|nr:60S ribosomal protein L22 [Candidatus Bathyarchaeota archaeon]
MVEMKIDASEIKHEGKTIIKELADFLKEKTNAEIATEAETVTVKGEGEAVSKKYLRVIVKKFLHKQELKEYYRVIADAEDTLKVKERRLYDEEEE